MGQISVEIMRPTGSLLGGNQHTLLTEENKMNRIIYIVGLVVIVLVILGFFGLR